MFSNLLSSVNENITSALDDLVFINSDITKTLTYVIGTNSYSGINLICNSLIYGFLLYYGISYLLSHLTFAQVETPLQFTFKLLLCAFALNYSESLCSGLIFICAHISDMICELGNYMFGFDISFDSLLNDVIPPEYFTSNSFSLFSFDRNIKNFYIFWILKFNCLLCYSLYYYKNISYTCSFCNTLFS